MSYEIVPLAHPIPQACKRVGIGETKLREAIKAGELEIVKIGDRTLIEDDELRRWLATKRQRAA
jgi:excisionase family DNA binding protein